MDKEKIILALLTPRSGELNYRYLIPEGVSYNDMQLGEIRNQLERSEKDRPGLLFQCEARQLGGRMGTESLIFQVLEFQLYPQEEQNQCRELLQDWFDNKREAVIQAIDWSSQGNASMIAIPELTQLRNQISEILSTPSKIDQSSDSVAVPTKNRFSFVHKIIMLAVTLSILLISAINIPFGIPQKIHEKIYEKIFGESNVQEQEKKLLGELAPYKNLFQFPTEPTKSTNYKDAFNDLYRYCGKTPTDIDQYLRDKDLKDLVQQQKRSRYPVFGTVPEEDRVKLLDNVKGISPVQLRRILAAYKIMQDSQSDEPPNSVFNSKLNEFKIVFPTEDNATNLIDYPKKTAQPMFFVQYESAKELDWAMTVRRFIISIIKEKQSNNVVTKLNLSQMNLLELIECYTLFENAKCESDKMQGAFNKFYSVLENIANETNADKTKN